jgi:hypothetical protein
MINNALCFLVFKIFLYTLLRKTSFEECYEHSNIVSNERRDVVGKGG